LNGRLALDAAGFLPGPAGAAANAAGAALDFHEGDYISGSLSAASMIPGVGYFFAFWRKARKAAKLAKLTEGLGDAQKAAKAADAAADAKKAAGVAAEAAGTAKPRADVPKGKYRGGKHEDMKKPKGDGLDSNHSPPRSVSPFDPEKGPAWQMEPRDHRLTESWGNSKSAQAWRKRQKDLIDQGKLREAI
jgi:hypothetical protein